VVRPGNVIALIGA